MAGGVQWQGGHVWQGSHACQGVCMARDVHGKGMYVVGETATAMDGMHPTGMHSCFHAVFGKIFEK